jgi:hypothetical protein
MSFGVTRAPKARKVLFFIFANQRVGRRAVLVQEPLVVILSSLEVPLACPVVWLTVQASSLSFHRHVLLDVLKRVIVAGTIKCL